MPTPHDPLQPKVASYLKSAWYIRWAVVAIVLASFWFMPDVNRPAIAVMTAAAVAYNLLLLAAGRHIGWLSSRSLILLVDGALALLLVFYTGGVASPYLLILAFMIISGAYWYGLWVAILIGLVQTALLVAQHFIASQQLAVPKSVIVQMAVMIAAGVYVSLLTKSDLSERRQLLDLGTETEKERQQLLALINNMGEAALVLDREDRVVICNQAAQALIGGAKDLRGQSVSQALLFLDGQDRPTDLRLKRGGQAFEREDLRLKAPDGSLVNVTVSAAPYSVDRHNSGHVLIIRDTSQDKTISQEREEFVAVASHELRTPLTIAQSEISLLLSPPYLPQNREAVGMLNSALRSLQQLSHIIKDLTNLSQVENEKLEVDLEPLNPIALLNEFVSDYEDQAKAKGLNMRVEIDPDLNSTTILTSRYVVREILSIFVTNAIKFSDRGSVVLAVTNPGDNRHGVTFRISDNGPGIAHSDQSKIFEKFFQGENYATRSHGGTGLGLYIAKQLAARITGRLWFETELGKGSSFYLWVPPYSRHAQDRGKVAAAETKDFFNTV